MSSVFDPGSPAMLIVCPSCATSYLVEPVSLGPAGRSVRCARCRTVWLAEPSATPRKPEEGFPEASQPVGDSLATEYNPGGEDEIAEAGEFHWTFAPDDGRESDRGPETTQAFDAAPDDFRTATQFESVPARSEFSRALVAAAPTSFLASTTEPEAIPLPANEENVAATTGNIESVAARRARAPEKSRLRRRKWQLPRLAAAVTALGVAVFAVVGWRAEIARVAPQTASLFGAIGLPVNLRGLVFENVRTTTEVHEGVSMLIVEGSIANAAKKTVEVPRLRFAMRNGAGLEVYAWTAMPGRTILAPGETAPFRTRLAAPPADGRDVIVRFFNRRDVVAGMR